MKLTADREGNHRQFSAKLGLRERFDPKEIEMLSAGAVPMLIPPAAVRGKKNNVIQYDISAYSTLDFYLSCVLSREQFAELLLQCIDVLQRMQKLYLNYKNLVFDLDKVYISLQDRSVHFIYLPLLNSKREASIPDFFRLLVAKANRSTYEQHSFLDACHAWLMRPTAFSLDELANFIRSNTALGRTSPASIEQVENRKPVPDVEKGYVPLQTRGISAAGGTVVLGAENAQTNVTRYSLIRVQTGEKIYLTHFPFLIGTEYGKVSYCVTGNNAISRQHAALSLQNGKCVITDRNSTNQTRVNDMILEPLVACALKNGDSIRLANEDFTVICEE